MTPAEIIARSDNTSAVRRSLRTVPAACACLSGAAKSRVIRRARACRAGALGPVSSAGTSACASPCCSMIAFSKTMNASAWSATARARFELGQVALEDRRAERKTIARPPNFPPCHAAPVWVVGVALNGGDRRLPAFVATVAAAPCTDWPISVVSFWLQDLPLMCRVPLLA